MFPNKSPPNFCLPSKSLYTNFLYKRHLLPWALYKDRFLLTWRTVPLMQVNPARISQPFWSPKCTTLSMLLLNTLNFSLRILFVTKVCGRTPRHMKWTIWPLLRCSATDLLFSKILYYPWHLNVNESPIYLVAIVFYLWKIPVPLLNAPQTSGVQ